MKSKSSMGSSEHPAGSPVKWLYSDPETSPRLTGHLVKSFSRLPSYRPIVFICIGTDRSTGDALGPLVGSRLKKYSSKAYHLFGTLDEPVHAMNLGKTITAIEQSFTNPFVVAIDACLGQVSSVGCIQLGKEPLKPGAGVNKQLPSVGHMHITGIVNVGGFMEYFVLQNTRLHLVMNIAETISDSIHQSFLEMGNASSTSFVQFDG